MPRNLRAHIDVCIGSGRNGAPAKHELRRRRGEEAGNEFSSGENRDYEASHHGEDFVHNHEAGELNSHRIFRQTFFA
jgi:hypothetical protein